MMFPFKKSRALFCFSSTIDEHTDTVHLTELFFSYETVTHWGVGEEQPSDKF